MRDTLCIPSYMSVRKTTAVIIIFNWDCVYKRFLQIEQLSSLMGNIQLWEGGLGVRQNTKSEISMFLLAKLYEEIAGK